MITRILRSAVGLILGILLGSSCAFSYASQVALTLPSNVARSGSSFVTAGSAAFNGASFNSAFTTQVAGRAVTVPAAWRLASNAPQIAVAAIRLSPASLAVGAVAAWLLPYGLQWLNNQWVSDNSMAVGTVYGYDAIGWFTSQSSACSAACVNQHSWAAPAQYCQSYTSGNCNGLLADGTTRTYATVTGKAGCPSNFTLNGTQCVGSAQTVDQGFTRAVGSQLPDPVSSQLSPVPVPLPLDSPTVSPTPIDVPISDPYVDPVTGKRFKDVARVTPQPSKPDTAEVQVVKQEVDANGAPVVNPTTGQSTPPVDQPDLCKQHPDILACQQLDTPSDPNITNNDKNISITPDSGWGADSGSCPADRTMTLHGQTVAYSWSPVCTYAGIMRYPIIGFAWLTAVLIALGMSQRYS